MVSIGRVELLNRHEPCCYKRTKNIEVRLANELPESTKEMFTGGELLGTFKGPASKNQSVEIYSAQGWEQKKGHFLIIQMDMGAGKDHLNLKEVVAYGVAHSYRTGTMCLMSKNCRRQSFKPFLSFLQILLKLITAPRFCGKAGSCYICLVEHKSKI